MAPLKQYATILKHVDTGINTSLRHHEYTEQWAMEHYVMLTVSGSQTAQDDCVVILEKSHTLVVLIGQRISLVHATSFVCQILNQGNAEPRSPSSWPQQSVLFAVTDDLLVLPLCCCSTSNGHILDFHLSDIDRSCTRMVVVEKRLDHIVTCYFLW